MFWQSLKGVQTLEALYVYESNGHCHNYVPTYEKLHINLIKGKSYACISISVYLLKNGLYCAKNLN